MIAFRFAVLLTLGAPCALAQSAFVHTARGDTVLVEQFRRTATRLDAELFAKGGVKQVLSSSISADGRLGEMRLTVFGPNARAEAKPIAQAQVMMVGDTAVVTTQQASGAPVPTQRIASRAAAQPLMNSSFAQFEVLLAAARKAGTPTSKATVFLQNGATRDIEFSGLRTDSVSALLGPTAVWMVTDKAGRILRAGIPTQSLTVSRVDGLAATKLGIAKPDYSAPTNAPYSAENVAVPTTFGHSLGGTFTKPTGVTGTVPVVVTITGSGSQDRDEYIGIVPGGYRLFRQLADTLGRRGIATLRLDDRGYGESGGDAGTATSADYANDVRAALTFLRARSDVDTKQIYLAGHSEGGLIAPMVAADDPALAGMVLMAGTGRTGREIIAFQVGYAVQRDTSMSPAQRAERLAKIPAQLDSIARSSPWMGYFMQYDPIATARRVKTPVLILHGGDDQQVIAAEATMLERAFRAGGNRSVTMRVFPELNHLFIRQPGGDPSGYAMLPSNLAVPEVMGAVADWIAGRVSRTTR